MSPTDIKRLQAYLQTTFGNDQIVLVARGKPADSAEVTINGEFLGVIYRDDDEGDVSFDFHMSVLDMDLPQG